MRFGLLLGAGACSGGAEPTETADTGTAAEWIGQAACGSVRVFATAGDRGLTVELRADVVQAVLDQTVLDVSGPATGQVGDGMTDGDICRTVEGYPPSGDWRITGGTVHVVFTPAAGLGPDDQWTWDGTEVGTVQVELRELVLTPVDGAPPAGVPDLDLDLPLVRPDLPA